MNCRRTCVDDYLVLPWDFLIKIICWYRYIPILRKGKWSVTQKLCESVFFPLRWRDISACKVTKFIISLYWICDKFYPDIWKNIGRVVDDTHLYFKIESEDISLITSCFKETQQCIGVILTRYWKFVMERAKISPSRRTIMVRFPCLIALLS